MSLSILSCSVVFHHVPLCSIVLHLVPSCFTLFRYVPLWLVECHHVVTWCSAMFRHVPPCSAMFRRCWQACPCSVRRPHAACRRRRCYTPSVSWLLSAPHTPPTGSGAWRGSTTTTTPQRAREWNWGAGHSPSTPFTLLMINND